MTNPYTSRFTLIDSEVFSDYHISSSTFLNFTHISENNFREKYPEKIPYPMTITIENVMTSSVSDVFNCREILSTSPEFDSPLPIAVRYIDSNNTYYIERPPFQVDINILMSRTGNIKKTNSFGDFKIWIPWTIAVFNPNYSPNISLYFSHKSLSSMEDIYFPSFLPNTFASGSICLGSYVTTFAQENNLINNPDLRYVYSTILNEYLNGSWNLDISPNIDHYSSYYYQQLALNKITPEDYPTLYNFFNPTEEQLSKAPFKIRKNVLQKYIDTKYSQHAYAYSYKYMYTLFSTFDLNETISFYRELAEFQQYLTNNNSSVFNSYAMQVRTFQNLIDTSHSYSLSPENKYYKSTFFNIFNNISSTVSAALYQNVSNFIPYSAPPFSANIIFKATDSFSLNVNNISNYTSYATHHDLPSNVAHSLFTKLIYISQNNLYDLSKTIVIYDLEDNSITFDAFTNDESCTFADYYFNYLHNLYSNTSIESVS